MLVEDMTIIPASDFISFRNGIELSREDYKTIDTLFPSHEENGYLLAAYEYNPYDISPKEEMRIWVNQQIL